MIFDPQKLPARLQKEALALGFEVCRITEAKHSTQIGDRLTIAIENGYHASMEWLAESVERRSQPTAMWGEAKSAIVLAMNYGPDLNPLDNLENKDRAQISVYARNRDYHDVMKGKLKELAGKFARWSGFDVKVFVDTAPLMEKPLAAKAGLGWQGKHTNLVSREFGSWLFLGVILTDAELASDDAERDHCGNCRACLDICPTNAFPAPYQLDGARCISYLTIEHHGPIPEDLRKPMGNRIYGCDDCLAICPWNKFAVLASEQKLQAREDLKSPELAELAELDDAGFRKHFSGSPVKRIGRNRFIRNVLIAIGNSKSTSLITSAKSHLDDPDPTVRGAAIWALKQLVSDNEFATQRASYVDNEHDATVLEEWKTND